MGEVRRDAAGWYQQHGGNGQSSTGSRGLPYPHTRAMEGSCQREDRSEDEPAVGPSGLSLELDAFVADLRAGQRRQGTLRFYAQKLGPFVDYLTASGIWRPEELMPDAIRGFMLKLAESHSPGGCHAYWRAIRAFTRFMLREGALGRDPMAALRAPHVDQQPLEPVSLADVQAMVGTCKRSERDLRDASILLVLLDTGLRANEAVALDVGDLDLRDGSLLIRTAKNRTPRVVICGANARRALGRYLRMRRHVGGDGPLWLAYHRGGPTTRLTYAGLREIVRRRARLADIAAPTLHSFRRAFAIEMLRNGADLITLGRMMGHGSLPVLRRYLRQDKTDLISVHRVCSPADSMTGRGRR